MWNFGLSILSLKLLYLYIIQYIPYIEDLEYLYTDGQIVDFGPKFGPQFGQFRPQFGHFWRYFIDMAYECPLHWKGISKLR